MQYAEENSVPLKALPPAETLESKTYDALRLALRDTFVPDQPLNASAIARQLGVSRMPVVQAFQRLIAEGFLTSEPHKGVRVAKPTRAAIRERYLTLIALETLCATEALLVAPKELARQMRAHRNHALDSDSDHSFHEVLWSLSGFPDVASHLSLLWERGTYYRALLFQGSPELATAQLAEHEAIVAAAERGDRDELVAALTRHRMAGMDRMLDVMAAQDSEYAADERQAR